jgi:hypothetical protein
MVLQYFKPDKGLVKRLIEGFSGLAQCEELDLKRAYKLASKKVRLPFDNFPIQLVVGSDENILHVYPERQINDMQPNALIDRYIIFNPKFFYKDVSGFLRLNSGEKIIIGRSDENQMVLLNFPKEIAARHLSIFNDKGRLVFKNLDDFRGTCISPLIKPKDFNRINKWRFAKLKRIRDIFGGKIDLLSPPNSLELINSVNKLLENEPYRPCDIFGKPGGVVALPRDSIPLLVGDLHAKIDNLIVVLSQNGFIEAMKKGRATLVILGDAVHSEDDDQLEEMQSSMLIMDLIFKLKLRFPEQVFYLRGNHDSFSNELGKKGIPQGIIWENALIKSCGKHYRDEMQRFYDLLPYIAYSDNFIACHAAPPTSPVSFKELVNIKENQNLTNELINNRLRTPNKPSGYFKRDIKNFRKCLGVKPDTPVIVGHTPVTNDDTLWENVGDIDNHHVIYGADTRWVGVVTMIGKKMYSFRYPTEELLPLINAIES